jgi:hypothetical protein
MTNVTLHKIALAIFLLGLMMTIASVPAQATAIHIEMTTTNGTVPGTGITYTITDNGDGGPRNIFPGATSDNGVWTWNNGFPEFLSFGNPQTLTVTFSAPVGISHLVLGLNSTSSSTSTLVVGGGTAGTADFNVTDSLNVYTGSSAALFTAATGVIATTGTNGGQNQSVMIGSTSSKTITSFTLNAGASDGGADGYTAFVGFTQAAAVPEPANVLLFGVGLGLLCIRCIAGRLLHR